jgi:ribosome-binding protein aMBF1 (putative translation factor)
MPTREKRQLVPITADARRVIREVRGRLGLSRQTLEQRTKLGKGYVKDVELGRTQSAESARLKRLLQMVQQVATHGQVPTKIIAGVARALRSVEKQGTNGTKK